MKFAEKWKRFWTLNRHHAAGFTLVELIVVIAILAILAGVAVPAYSGYIAETNKTADMALAADVANALQMHYYSGIANNSASQSGYVILNYGTAPEYDAYGEAAMIAAFGENWKDTVRLQYNGWVFDKSLFSAMMSITGGYAASAPDSSYITNVGTQELLKDVQETSGALAKFIARIEDLGVDGVDALNAFLGVELDGNDGILNGYEISDEERSTVLANATVFGLAATLKDEATASSTVDKFDSGYYINRFNPSNTNGWTAINKDSADVLVDVAHTYAALEAFVGYLNDPDATAAFDSLNATLQGDNLSRAQVVDLINQTGKTIARRGALTGKTDAYLTGQSKKDGEGYVAIMQTVDSLGGDYQQSLGANDLFTGDENIADRVDTFIAAAASSNADLSKLPPDILDKINNGSTLVIVFAVGADGQPACSVLFGGDQ